MSCYTQSAQGPAHVGDEHSVNAVVAAVVVVVTIIVAILWPKASRRLKSQEGAAGTVRSACHSPCFGTHRSVSRRLCPWNSVPRGYSWVRGGVGQTGSGTAGLSRNKQLYLLQASQASVQLPEETRACGAFGRPGPWNRFSSSFTWASQG